MQVLATTSLPAGRTPWYVVRAWSEGARAPCLAVSRPRVADLASRDPSQRGPVATGALRLPAQLSYALHQLRLSCAPSTHFRFWIARSSRSGVGRPVQGLSASQDRISKKNSVEIRNRKRSGFGDYTRARVGAAGAAAAPPRRRPCARPAYCRPSDLALAAPGSRQLRRLCRAELST